MEFYSEEDYLDALYAAHQDGECQAFLKRSTYCTYCQLELDRQAYEERKNNGKS